MVSLQDNVQRWGRMTGLETKKLNILLLLFFNFLFLFVVVVQLNGPGSSGLTHLWLTPLGE